MQGLAFVISWNIVYGTSTLLLYLVDICIFAPSIDVMTDHIELVLHKLKNSTLKLGQRNDIFDTSILFLDYVLSARGILANPKKVQKVRDRLPYTNAKVGPSFLGPTIVGLFLNLLRWPIADMN